MIKINTKIINLDVSKKLYEKLVAKQGDTKSRFLLFNLSSNGAAINLTNRNVRVYAVKPDGREVFNDLVVSDPARGVCILELTNQVLAIPGVVKMELMITEGQKKLTSFEFELEVVKKLNNETSIVSANEFTALVNGLASLSEYDNYKNEIKTARGSFANLLAHLTSKMNATKGTSNDKFPDIFVGNYLGNTNGFNKITNGYLEAWGSVRVAVNPDNTNNIKVVTLPILFNNIFGLSATCSYNYTDSGHLNIEDVNVTAMASANGEITIKYRALNTTMTQKDFEIKFKVFGN